MSEHVFLYRIKNSNDRDCCAYIDANDPDFVCNHYFSSVGICGSCYSGKDWANYDDIETILTRTESEHGKIFNVKSLVFRDYIFT